MYLSLDSSMHGEVLRCVCVSTLSLLTQRSHPEFSPTRPCPIPDLYYYPPPPNN